MKKMILALAIFLFAAGVQTFAQTTPKAKKEGFSWQKVHMDEAGIPADVQAKIEVINKESGVKVKEIRKDATLAEDVKKERIKEVNKKKGDDINALLTKEQKAKIKDIKERLKKESESD